MMGRFVLGVIIGITILAGGTYFYFTTGMAPSAATAPPIPFEKYFANAALHARLQRDAPKAAPPQIPATTENLLAGARIYKKDCAICHGLPNTQPSQQGRTMYPPAPQLFVQSEMVSDMTPGDIYWVLHNGIRLTGMASFGSQLTYQQMWQVALLVHNADKLPPRVSAALATPASAAEPAMPSPSSTRPPN